MILTRVEERARDRRYQTGAEVLARQKEVPSRRLEQQTQIRYGGGNSPVRHDVVITPEDVGKLAVWAKEGYLAVAGNGLGGDTIAGPLTIGTPALSPPPLPATLVADQTVTRINAAGQAQVGLNLYTDAAGTLRYVGDGPGADLGVHSTTVAGAVVPRFAINIAANNTAGPGAAVTQVLGGLNIVAGTDPSGNIAPFTVIGSGIDVPPTNPIKDSLIAHQLSIQAVPTGSENVAHFGMNMYEDEGNQWRYLDNGCGALIDTHTQGTNVGRLSVSVYDVNAAGPGAVPSSSIGALQIVYGAPGQAPQPFVVVGAGYEIPLSVFPRRGTLMAEDLAIRADPLVAGADRVSRLGLNAYQDNTGVAWHYVTDGPGGSITIHDANVGVTSLPAPSMRFGVADPGNAGDPLVNTPRFVMFGVAGTGANQTNMMLLVNTTGTPTLTQVQVGPPDSGGTGLRALVVPN